MNPYLPKMAKIGVLVDKKAAERRWRLGVNVFGVYIEEVLSQGGIPFVSVDDVQRIDHTFDIVIAAVTKEDVSTAAVLSSYMEQGGIVVVYAGLQAMASQLGAVPIGNTGPGYYKPSESYSKSDSIRYYNARPWTIESGQESFAGEAGSLVAGNPEGEGICAALQRFQIGGGFLARWAVDIIESIVVFQQGSRPVWEDGFPAMDGSAAVNEGILKADDQTEFSWEWDRATTETGTPYFNKPHADYWREILIGQLLSEVVRLGLTLPFVGYWPDGVRQVAMISHDSDLNEDEHAWSTLDILSEAGIKSTWCMLEPGYSAEVYEKVKEAGHELAFHYNALEKDGGRWGEEEFNRQLTWLKTAANIGRVTSNKNHYTRYEGWGELFRWCEEHRIESDQTRGPSKKGNVGFLFGTCHPYFPISWADERNRVYNVLEIGFLTQDMDGHPIWPDSSVIVPFLDEVRKVEGVAHFLFHQIHLHSKPEVREAFHKVVAEAGNRGFTFWTAEQINRWQRARKRLKLGIDQAGNVTVSGAAESDAVIWIPVSPECAAKEQAVEVRFGIPCVRKTKAELLHSRSLPNAAGMGNA